MQFASDRLFLQFAVPASSILLTVLIKQHCGTRGFRKGFTKQHLLHEVGLESRSPGGDAMALHEMSIHVFLVWTNHARKVSVLWI